ncbi:hypothetical protein MSM1_17685 [Mycobacterium sp. SM1]|uniref:hypothetical protein n=1 Tax=Mycobacterium sp. SM1 TaxID=2816243 RepID=UPI001BCBB0B9|nr:hypothetical protein [Mycobacterium sp. SM1]MBS4730084.1 hypothetical protein [Mycobacterium sp. SM1]
MTRCGCTLAECTAKVHAVTGHDHSSYTVRQAAYGLPKLRGTQLVDKPAQTRRYLVPTQAARTIAALLTPRDQVIAPILAGIPSPRMGRKPAHWTRLDRDYEQLRVNMQTLFADLAIETGHRNPASRLRIHNHPSHFTSTTNCRKSILKRLAPPYRATRRYDAGKLAQYLAR